MSTRVVLSQFYFVTRQPASYRPPFRESFWERLYLKTWRAAFPSNSSFFSPSSRSHASKTIFPGHISPQCSASPSGAPELPPAPHVRCCADLLSASSVIQALESSAPIAPGPCQVCDLAATDPCISCNQPFCLRHLYPCADCQFPFCGTCLDLHLADGHWSDSDTADAMARATSPRLAPCQHTIRPTLAAAHSQHQAADAAHSNATSPESAAAHPNLTLQESTRAPAPPDLPNSALAAARPKATNLNSTLASSRLEASHLNSFFVRSYAPTSHSSTFAVNDPPNISVAFAPSATSSTRPSSLHRVALFLRGLLSAANLSAVSSLRLSLEARL